MRFDPDVLREIMWQGMTNEERINSQELEEDFYDDQYLIDQDFDEDQELIEEDFDDKGRSCVRSLWAALASKFCKQLHRW